jgi:PhnB protein
MALLQSYLTFDGRCEEAMIFYQSCFGGEFNLMRFGDTPQPVAEEHKNRIMHTQFKSGAIDFMASDCMPGQPYNIGNNVTLSLSFDDEAEQEVVFNKLAEGGMVVMPLADQFWDAKFGMLVDKFGFSWMLNCQKKKV